MNSALLIVLTCVVAYRLTRLVVKDQFPPIAVQRARIAERWGEDSWQAYLSQCAWCAGFYIAGPIVLAVDLIEGLPVPVLVWGTAWAACGFLAAWDDPDSFFDKAG